MFMKRFALPISIAAIAFLIGVAIGHYSFPIATTSSPSRPASAPGADVISSLTTNFAPRIISAPASDSSEKSSGSSNGETIIAGLKAALAHSDSRRAYLELGKLAESINDKNVGEVMAFAETLPKQREKSMLVSLLL